MEYQKTQFLRSSQSAEKMCADTAEKVDEITKRILMLGGTPAYKSSDNLKEQENRFGCWWLIIVNNWKYS